ncbi:MAG: hypothetical protein HQL40_08320 [Alphaproteobacteria bacterium]|nr:hypothetical protein [Alphaproteobacteria bacterium]
MSEPLNDAAKEFISTWKALERGEAVAPRDTLSFADWPALAAVMTAKRYALLRHVRARPAAGVRDLARSLGRDVRRVHGDVVALEELGLLVRDPETGAISAGYDDIVTVIRIAS